MYTNACKLDIQHCNDFSTCWYDNGTMSLEWFSSCAECQILIPKILFKSIFNVDWPTNGEIGSCLHRLFRHEKRNSSIFQSNLSWSFCGPVQIRTWPNYGPLSSVYNWKPARGYYLYFHSFQSMLLRFKDSVRHFRYKNSHSSKHFIQIWMERKRPKSVQSIILLQFQCTGAD